MYGMCVHTAQLVVGHCVLLVGGRRTSGVRKTGRMMCVTTKKAVASENLKRDKQSPRVIAFSKN